MAYDRRPPLSTCPTATGTWSETKGFDSQDGISLQWLSWQGIKTGVISGRVSPATGSAPVNAR